MFSDKLNFIMNVTRTQASALGKACNLDPSYVSRLRNGSRPLPKKAAYFNKMTAYLAGRIVTDYQKKAIGDAMRLSTFPIDKKQTAKLIGKWLITEEKDPTDISVLLESFSETKNGDNISPVNIPLSTEAKSYYYGIDGKREAVLQFFSMILKEKTPRTLLLFSEEEMDWLYEDDAFAARWASDFTKVLMAGNRVKIIHNIGRGMNEMLEAVAKWIPVYTTGMIEPYYYPKLRDGVFRRTLFIAPGTAAVVSASVDRKTDGMLNWLVTDKEAIPALTLEFGNYFTLCRPLMNIMTVPKRAELWKAYKALIDADGDMICMSDMPTLATMPEQVARAMQERVPESIIYEQWQAVQTGMKKHRKALYAEILPQFEPDLENVPLPCADLLGAAGLCYTKEEWNAHVKASARYGARHKKYSQYIRSGIPKNVCLFLKEGRGVIMTKRNAPGSAFAFSEANMVGAFTDHLKRIIEE